jgi:hypothetical protein
VKDDARLWRESGEPKAQARRFQDDFKVNPRLADVAACYYIEGGVAALGQKDAKAACQTIGQVA